MVGAVRATATCRRRDPAPHRDVWIIFPTAVLPLSGPQWDSAWLVQLLVTKAAVHTLKNRGRLAAKAIRGWRGRFRNLPANRILANRPPGSVLIHHPRARPSFMPVLTVNPRWKLNASVGDR